MEIRSSILNFLRYVFLILFVYAAVSKLLDFDTFQNQLGQSTVLSAHAFWLVWAVPVLEIMISICLVLPYLRLLGLYGFLSMMVLFTAYIVIILNFSPFVPCSCGGVLEALTWSQHLVFNFVFIILSAFLVFQYEQQRNPGVKKNISKLLGVVLINSAVVTGIYLSVDIQNKRNNAFVRKYMPHPIEKIGAYDLKYNTYYIAGLEEQTIYLGNHVAPLSLQLIDISLQDAETVQMKIDSMELPYRKVQVVIEPPYFYVGDGSVPVLFRGKTNEWKASVYSYDDVYFNSYEVQDSGAVGFTSISSEKSRILGQLMPQAKDKIQLNKSILEKQFDGLFDTDGQLLWNDQRQEFIYTYYYRNSFLVADRQMNLKSTGQTIDTITQAVVDVAHYKKQGKYKKGGKSIRVNLQATTEGNYLYILSDRLGKYDDEELLKSAALIDVYDLRDRTYAFSFLLYHQAGEKLRQFQVKNDLLIALVDDTLWLYRLKPAYFETETTSRHTARGIRKKTEHL